MAERLYLDRPDVYLLADCDPTAGGRVRLVVCEHPDGAAYAAHLALVLGIPVQNGPGPDPAPVPSAAGCREPEPA